MKNALIVLLLLVPLVTYAQRYPTGKGTFRSGGGVSFSRSNEEYFKEYTFNMTPRIGYFVTDNLSIGFTSNLTFIYDTTFSTAIKFTPQFKYFYPLSKSMFLIGNGQVLLDRATRFADPNVVKDQSQFGLGPGFAYYFSRRVGFEIDIVYTQYFNPDPTHQSSLVGDGALIFNILSNKDKKKANRKGNYELQPEDDE